MKGKRRMKNKKKRNVSKRNRMLEYFQKRKQCSKKVLMFFCFFF